MAKLKKFGTFGGVFTPSILTILGVIMYLRFPTILGQAGLINTIGIIVIAHIISITTSLSVASLSTDKTVKTGGTYFMISRSLGLPIGGTLGIALFVGLSFATSLYLIGFAESFLAYWNMDSSINSVRITGSIILLIVTTITFISASLAIKSQYFIMAAIVLSLLSIFFGNHEFAPREINLKPMADAAPFMLLFGIFFPAVTGFEAGVAMSGDLKDAKKSLPIGAMAAVGVGFIVYVFLAFFYTYTVDAEALRNDPQVLFKISLVPVLVVIGIWGATLSSALGSILGAPRILQAIAMDKIAPKIFAKGTGKTQEPRNALLLAFVIAEAGILIGELDVIARIVSMFFITTYAFLNLASAIESWSSSDFRPAFKIPKFVSILGAVSAFIVMILLDFIALAGAVVVLGLLFFYLSRKELVLETGDAWSSFWANLAKRSLLKLTNQKTDKRNWRPNIILFRGGKQERLHLVELGLAMSGKLGSLTDFELVIGSGNNAQPVKTQNNSNREEHFFSRQIVSNSLENGINTVTSVYGFSGFEPNTVLMGWSHDPKNASMVANILSDLKKKNMNAVFLDYDKNAGFGKKERIDIWWNGKGRHLSFALNLMRFILSDNEWRDANLRILIINGDNKITDKLYRNTTTLLQEKRIAAEVKIISDDFGTRSKEMIINSESVEADLIILGISPNASSYTTNYIESIGHLNKLPASLLILSPSKEFEEINILGSASKPKAIETTGEAVAELPPLPVIENKLLKIRIEKLDEDLLSLANGFVENTIIDAVNLQVGFLKNMREFFEFNMKNTEVALTNQKGEKLSKSAIKNHQIFLAFVTQLLQKQGNETLLEIKDTLSSGIAAFQAKSGNFIFESPETIIVTKGQEGSKKEKGISIPFKKMVEDTIQKSMLPYMWAHLRNFDNNTILLYTELKNIALKTNDIYEKRKLIESDFSADLQTAKQQILNDFDTLQALLLNQIPKSKSEIFSAVRAHVIEMGNDIVSPDPRKQINKKLKTKSKLTDENLTSFPDDWEADAKILNNAVLLDCQVLSEQKIIQEIIMGFTDKVNSIVTENVISPIDKILNNIETSISLESKQIKNIAFNDNLKVRLLFQDVYLKILELLERLPVVLEIADFTHSNDGAAVISEISAPVLVEPQKIARFYFDTLFYEQFFRELEQMDKLVQQSIVESREVHSLLKFRLENELREPQQDLMPNNGFSGFLASLQKQVNIEKNRLSEALAHLKYKSEESLKNAISPLYSHAIIESQHKISTLLREHQGKKFGIIFTKNWELIKGETNALIVDVLYSSSRGVIKAKKYLTKSEGTKTGIQQILDVAEKEMPDQKIYPQIPVFYRTLFNSKSLINDDFWVPMENETALLKSAIQRHKNGLGGAVLITGPHGSGKTALTRYCATKHFKKDRIFTITAPIGGSVNIDDWLSQLREAIGDGADSTEIFRNMPHESAVVINDLELWWERTNNGYAVLSEIVDLIRVFGKKVFFLINTNTFSLRQISRVFPMEDNFLSVVECSPFGAKQLQQLIQRRHKTSGLTYHYKNVPEESISKIRTASLFNSYFTYSQGVPGVAMNAWIANIVKAAGQDIFIAKPKHANHEVLHNINPDWLIAIALFIQHKNLSAKKLARIMGAPDAEAEDMIYNLSNARIVEARDNEVYTLGKYMEPFLVKVIADKGII
jgi:amino acid transporter